MSNLPNRASDAGPEYSHLTECVRCGQEMSWAISELCASCEADDKRQECPWCEKPVSEEESRVGEGFPDHRYWHTRCWNEYREEDRRQNEEDDVCECRLTGDVADASDCPVHGGSR